MKLILGSSSRFRQQVLKEMGYEFEVLSPEINEKEIRDSDPQKLVLAIALAKSEAIQQKLNDDAIVITGDQVVTFEGVIREKPTSEEEAREFLKSYGDAASLTINGVVVTNTKTGRTVTGVDIVEVRLNQISDDVIEKLIDEGIIFHCAGALRLEDPLMVPFIKEINGEQESLMGMPKKLTESLIEQVR